MRYIISESMYVARVCADCLGKPNMKMGWMGHGVQLSAELIRPTAHMGRSDTRIVAHCIVDVASHGIVYIATDCI